MDLLVVVLSFLAVLLIALTGIGMCLCCYCWLSKRNKENDTYKKMDDEGYYTLAPAEAVKEKKRETTPCKSSFKVKGQADRLWKTHSVQPPGDSQAGSIQTPGGYTLTRVQKEALNGPTVGELTQQRTLMQEVAMESTEAADQEHGVLGRIEFAVWYDASDSTLVLKIIRASGLPIKDLSGSSDPYVKILLLPDRKTKMKTEIRRKNLNPRWDETFRFEGFPYSKLIDRALYMQVLDYDRFSRDDPMGELYLPLGCMDLSLRQSIWMDLEPCEGHKGRLGELLLSLCYSSKRGTLTVVIMKARDLRAKDINGYSDPYVKIWLLRHGKKAEKKKTTIKQRELNPVYNESFVFDVALQEIRYTSLRVSVFDHDTVGRNDKIGEVLLGSKGGPVAVKHWRDMFNNKEKPLSQWHILNKID